MFIWLILAAILLLYFAFKPNYNYWKKRGVPGPEPKFLVGNIADNVFKRKQIGEVFVDIYRQFEGYPFVGIYKFYTPCLLIRDPDFVKQIVVKDFKYFYNNEIFIDKKVDPIFGRNPFVLKGEDWKISRSQLTPCFTSGKMKIIFPLVEEVSKRLVNYLTQNSNSVLEAKEICTKFTLDSVASCAFGINGNCFEDPNAEFRQIASNFVSPSSWQGIKVTLILVMPALSNFFSLKFLPTKVDIKLRRMLKETLQYREENNVVRKDFLDMMNNLKKSAKPGSFTDEDLVGHAASFFIDGFETSANVMSFVLYELACNQDAQDELRKEVESVLENHNGIWSYETVADMSYLEACIDESLRKNAPLPNLGKQCVESYTYTTTNTIEFKELNITVEPGTVIILPIRAFHYDPKYFPEPEKYKPERFLRENKEKMNKYTYMPLGEGPRACLGQNFGLLQIKIGLAHVIKQFKVTLNRMTKNPLQYDPWYFLIAPNHEVWLNFEKID